MRAFPAIILTMIVLAGCSREPASDNFKARLENRVLTSEDISRTLSAVGPGLLDTADAESRIVEQWITDELLYQEGLRRGLRGTAAVQRQLEASERSVVVSALLETMYASTEAQPTEADLAAYFQEYRDQLRLLEPYVRVRALGVSEPDSIPMIQRRLSELDSADVDEWEASARRWAIDPEASIDLSRSYVPESRVFSDIASLNREISVLRPGRTTAVSVRDSLAYVVQLLDRVPAGTTPRLDWIRESLRQRLAIQSRKQLYARLVEQLRNEALARESLEIR